MNWFLICSSVFVALLAVVQINGNVVALSGLSPDVAVNSGNRNGGHGITKNQVAGNQHTKQAIEKYSNYEHNQLQRQGGFLGGLLH